MTLTVLSDVHIGAIRSAGTTTSSQYELRRAVLNDFSLLLPTSCDLLLLGDLFDTNSIPVSDVLETYIILNNWLRNNPDSKLYNVTGNHDASKTSNVLSSFQFLGKLLKLAHPTRYVHVEEPLMTPHGYIIPHLRNQDVFNLALQDVPEVDFLFVHCNYDNHFAAQADQSLNISAEQAQACKAKHIVFAHEHHGRMSGKVLVPGNQIATSVSDWLSKQDKRYLKIVGGKPEYVINKQRKDEFAELDWKSLEDSEHKFIRVVGEATADEASEVVNSINKFRKRSNAFVITNSVVIDTGAVKVDFDSTLESVQQFSVMDALREIMTPQEMAVLESL